MFYYICRMKSPLKFCSAWSCSVLRRLFIRLCRIIDVTAAVEARWQFNNSEYAKWESLPVRIVRRNCRRPPSAPCPSLHYLHHYSFSSFTLRRSLLLRFFLLLFLLLFLLFSFHLTFLINLPFLSRLDRAHESETKQWRDGLRTSDVE